MSYTSKVYGLTLEYPPGWSVVNEAARRWDVAVDGQVGWSSEALDTFTNPEGSVAVSVWQVPAGAGADANSSAWLAGWVEDLCRATGNEPCDGITDRLIPMCRERADCHPAAIVPFTDDVFGYVPVDDQVTIVAVWQPDTDISVAPYGGGVGLVQEFLKALNVWVPGQG